MEQLVGEERSYLQREVRRHICKENLRMRSQARERCAQLTDLVDKPVCKGKCLQWLGRYHSKMTIREATKWYICAVERAGTEWESDLDDILVLLSSTPILPLRLHGMSD